MKINCFMLVFKNKYNISSVIFIGNIPLKGKAFQSKFNLGISKIRAVIHPFKTFQFLSNFIKGYLHAIKNSHTF